MKSEGKAKEYTSLGLAVSVPSLSDPSFSLLPSFPSSHLNLNTEYPMTFRFEGDLVLVSLLLVKRKEMTSPTTLLSRSTFHQLLVLGCWFVSVLCTRFEIRAGFQGVDLYLLYFL